MPLLVIADLLGSHWHDVVTIDPAYWTVPPPTVERLRSDPDFIRVFGHADTKSSGEPGYASEPIDFMPVRDMLDWSLPAAWGVPTSKGITPMYAHRLFEFGDPLGITKSFPWRFELEGDSHFLRGRRGKPEPGEVAVGAAYLRQLPGALPRARIVARPAYAPDERQAVSLLVEMGKREELRDRVIVEEPLRPLPSSAKAEGTARIVEDLPESVVIEADLASPGYLVLADTFDPGWSATDDGRPVPIRPAYVAFRAVYLPAGHHTVHFTYRPAGFALGLVLSVIGLGLAVGLVLWSFRPRRAASARSRGAGLAATLADLLVTGAGDDRRGLGRDDRAGSDARRPSPLEQERPHLHLGGGHRGDETESPIGRAPGTRLIPAA